MSTCWPTLAKSGWDRTDRLRAGNGSMASTTTVIPLLPVFLEFPIYVQQLQLQILVQFDSIDLSEGLFTRKNPRTPPKKIRNKSKKSKDFFEDLKSVHHIWEWTTPRIQCLNPFLIVKSSYTKKKISKNPKNLQKIQGFFLGFKIRIPYLGVNNLSISVFKSFFIHKIRKNLKKSEKSDKKIQKFL